MNAPWSAGERTAFIVSMIKVQSFTGHNLITPPLLARHQIQGLCKGLQYRQARRNTGLDLPRSVVTRHPPPAMHQRPVRISQRRFPGHRVVPVPVGFGVAAFPAAIPAVGPLHGRNTIIAWRSGVDAGRARNTTHSQQQYQKRQGSPGTKMMEGPRAPSRPHTGWPRIKAGSDCRGSHAIPGSTLHTRCPP